MANSFPSELNTHKKDWANDTPVKGTHPEEHNDIAKAVEAIEAKLGVNDSSVQTSHDYKLSLITGADKAASKAVLDAHIVNISNPHGVTKAQVGLGSVTNHAQLKRSSGDINSFAEKAGADDDDVVLIEDSGNGYAKKKMKVSNFGGGGDDKVRVRAYKSGSDQALTTSFAQLTFESTSFDAESTFSASTFTAPRTGTYLVTANAVGENSGSSDDALTMAIYKNDTLVAQSALLKTVDTGAQSGINIIDVLELAENDTIKIYVKNSSAGQASFDAGEDKTYLAVTEL